MRVLFINIVVGLFLSGFVLAQESDFLTNTVINSDELEMKSGDDISDFHFIGNVHVSGTNLNMVANELHVTSEKRGDADATMGRVGKISKIIAIGDVYLKQEGRTAEAQYAEFFPEEGKVVMTGNPKVSDAQGTVQGSKIEWYHGERKARVIGDGQQKVVVTLPSMRDMGYKTEEEEAATNSANTEEETSAESEE